MAETDATPLGKFLAVIGHIGAIAAVVSIVAGAIAYALAAPGWFLGFCAGVCLLGVTMVFAWRVSLGSETPIETIGEWRREYVPPAKPDLLVRPFDIPHETKVEKPSGGLSLEDIEREYELKKLEPNFIDRGSEYIEAHNDEQGVIIRGTNPDGETFHALVRMFGNEHPRNNVKSLKRVSFRLKFICFDRATRNKSLSINTDRGAWLNEAQTEIEFAAHCPSKRAVVVTVEGAENQPYVSVQTRRGCYS